MGLDGNLAEWRISAEFPAYNSLLQKFILTYKITWGFSYWDTKHGPFRSCPSPQNEANPYYL
jgi:hypothetical protein